MKDNKYLEEFKIDVVKQYLQGKQKKDICKEYGIVWLVKVFEEELFILFDDFSSNYLMSQLV